VSKRFLRREILAIIRSILAKILQILAKIFCEEGFATLALEHGRLMGKAW
jgi:hypothetical protein